MQDKKFATMCALAFFTISPVIAGAQPMPPAPVAPAPTAPVAPAPVVAAAAADPKIEAAKIEKAAAKVEKAANENAQGNIDALRTGKLIASGLTGGVAFAVQFTGPFNNDSAKQVNPKGAIMPYIMALPAYWGAPQTTREACASEYSGAGEDVIDSAARAIARKRATRIVADIESLVAAAGASKADAALIAKELSLDYGNGTEEEDKATNERFVKQIISYVEQEDADAKRKVVINSMAGLEWKATKKARCWPKRFGIWVGLPVNYEVTTTVPNSDPKDTKQTAARNVKPVVAAGLAFSPNAYISVLLGITAGTVTRDASADQEALDRTIWATTLAVGGNLDIVTALAKAN